ncbi:CidA/LrgA family protein [Psychrobacter lutiphocae]|uniref:CidA/LrgA family protein n=1 Tax=Psychrobacter lutiphocae TaxID=540500 RepID=UPI0003658B37|nr:CidA/LrgA family protein [Psychrobacter lutiphocae]
MPSLTDHTIAPSKKSMPLPMAILLTLAIVICIREGAVFVCQAIGYASAANIVGMISFFVLLMLWRFTIGLPEWLTHASNTLLVDSGFAFLPVSAGAGLLIFALGDELWGIVITLVVSTLLPLWALAKLANAWLGGSPDNNVADSDSSSISDAESDLKDAKLNKANSQTTSTDQSQ